MLTSIKSIPKNANINKINRALVLKGIFSEVSSIILTTFRQGESVMPHLTSK